jgi:hypothetical protein
MRPVGPKRTHLKRWKEAGWCDTSPHIDSLPYSGLLDKRRFGYGT